MLIVQRKRRPSALPLFGKCYVYSFVLCIYIYYLNVCSRNLHFGCRLFDGRQQCCESALGGGSIDGNLRHRHQLVNLPLKHGIKQVLNTLEISEIMETAGHVMRNSLEKQGAVKAVLRLTQKFQTLPVKRVGLAVPGFSVPGFSQTPAVCHRGLVFAGDGAICVNSKRAH